MHKECHVNNKGVVHYTSAVSIGHPVELLLKWVQIWRQTQQVVTAHGKSVVLRGQ